MHRCSSKCSSSTTLRKWLSLTKFELFAVYSYATENASVESRIINLYSDSISDTKFTTASASLQEKRFITNTSFIDFANLQTTQKTVLNPPLTDINFTESSVSSSSKSPYFSLKFSLSP